MAPAPTGSSSTHGGMSRGGPSSRPSDGGSAPAGGAGGGRTTSATIHRTQNSIPPATADQNGLARPGISPGSASATLSAARVMSGAVVVIARVRVICGGGSSPSERSSRRSL